MSVNPPPGACHEGVSPNEVSPQTTGYTLPSNDHISPQVTGITSNPTSTSQSQPEAQTHPETLKTQPQEPFQGIEVVPNNMDQQSPAPEYTSEKPTTGQPLPPQGQYPPQQQVPVGQSRNNYQNATPIRSLQQGPAAVDCPVCGVREVTVVEYVSGMTTHLSALLCCFVTCLGCIPYMASAFKDAEQKCGHCGALLAIWHRSGRLETKVPVNY